MLQRARNLIRTPRQPRRRWWIGGAALAVVVIGLAAGFSLAARHGEPESKGTPASLRLLTQQQYLNTLSYVFGPNVQPTTRFRSPASYRRLAGERRGDGWTY